MYATSRAYITWSDCMKQVTGAVASDMTTAEQFTSMFCRKCLKADSFTNTLIIFALFRRSTGNQTCLDERYIIKSRVSWLHEWHNCWNISLPGPHRCFYTTVNVDFASAKIFESWRTSFELSYNGRRKVKFSEPKLLKIYYNTTSKHPWGGLVRASHTQVWIYIHFPFHLCGQQNTGRGLGVM